MKNNKIQLHSNQAPRGQTEPRTSVRLTPEMVIVTPSSRTLPNNLPPKAKLEKKPRALLIKMGSDNKLRIEEDS